MPDIASPTPQTIRPPEAGTLSPSTLCGHTVPHGVVFYYAGYFSQNIVAAMADAVKLRLTRIETAGTTRRKLFSSFIEMAQNIIHYSADTYDEMAQDIPNMRHGSVCIALDNQRYHLCCANPVRAEIAEQLHTKLRHLRSLTTEDIKREYKQTLRTPTPEGSKGAGLGLLTVARDASAPLEFEFSPDEVSGNIIFCLKATI